MKKNSLKSKVSRRHFLGTMGTLGAALAMPAILPGCATGSGPRPAPSGRVTLGVLGWGWQGPDNTKALMAVNECQVVAACDLDKEHLADAVNTINGHYKN